MIGDYLAKALNRMASDKVKDRKEASKELETTLRSDECKKFLDAKSTAILIGESRPQILGAVPVHRLPCCGAHSGWVGPCHPSLRHPAYIQSDFPKRCHCHSLYRPTGSGSAPIRRSALPMRWINVTVRRDVECVRGSMRPSLETLITPRYFLAGMSRRECG